MPRCAVIASGGECAGSADGLWRLGAGVLGGAWPVMLPSPREVRLEVDGDVGAEGVDGLGKGCKMSGSPGERQRD